MALSDREKVAHAFGVHLHAVIVTRGARLVQILRGDADHREYLHGEVVHVSAFLGLLPALRPPTLNIPTTLAIAKIVNLLFRQRCSRLTCFATGYPTTCLPGAT
ncbi:hypothetical protein EJK15_56880 [Nonomuraea basaltis]|nr:hypothetical protein EJK15_56880 [Nonomuraea basaltis]